MKLFSTVLFIIVTLTSCDAQKNTKSKNPSDQVIGAGSNQQAVTRIIPGAERLDQYLSLIKNKRVGVFANQTSMVGETHLVDVLRKQGIDIKVIFGPEHGFRGNADAGEKVGNYIDEQTGISVVSLYGTKRKPSAEDLKDIDILLFDIQDVGVRFYTYISSLEDLIESALEFNKPLIVLDRPNPNGHYVDGPVLEKEFKSFIGMQPVPIVYGMTIGEYANMLLFEKMLSEKSNKQWLSVMATRFKDNNHFSLAVILCKNYTHKSKYVLPIKPSPNLPEIQSIYLYPSTCFFEGTVLSEGRGTSKPFQFFGHPLLPKKLFSFTPQPNEVAKTPKLQGQLCYGWNLSGTAEEVFKKTESKVQLKWLMEAYRLFPDKENFFLKSKKENLQPTNYFFNKLAGNNELMQQIIAGKTESEIRKSWEPKLIEFKKTRKKYLLYPDFE
ncbi:MAG: DUF1343 domain-containing protein [Bacteroidota bacterium]|nr:DUF1343 domain-containing protein [Bacteroidota bacterium]